VIVIKSLSLCVRYILVSYFILFFGFLFPILVTGLTFNILTTALYSLSLFVVFRIVRIIVSRDVKLLELTFYAFTYIFLVIAPLVQVSKGWFPLGYRHYTDGEIIKTISIIMLGILGYEIGLNVGNKTKVTINDNYSNKNFKFIFAISIICMFFAILKFGGISNLGKDRTSIDTSYSLIYNSLLRVPIYITFMFCLLDFKRKKHNHDKIKGKHYILLILLLILNLIGSNPFYSARYWFGAVFISVILVFIKWKRNTLTYIIYATLLGFFIIFPYADVSRSGDKFSFGMSVIVNNLLVGDFDAFQQIMNISAYTSTFGIGFGRQFIGVLFFFVPRTIWLNKPIGTGTIIGESLGYINTNISAPLWSEFQINFGLIGVFVLFALYGILTAKLEKGYIKTRNQINFYQIFVPFFSFYQFFILRGSLISCFASLIPCLLCIWIGLKPNILKRNNKVKIYNNKAIENQ